MDTNQKSTVLITCSRGLSPCLQQEVSRLGYGLESSSERGVTVSASLRDTMRLNLHLRTASSVLYLLKRFRCATPDELYREATSLPWEDIISPEEYLSVVSRVETLSISHTNYPSLKVKDAIVDRVKRHAGARPNSGSERDHVVVHLYWKGDQCKLYLNTSGVKLSDRGYRKLPCKAPLRENLAAGVILSTGYDGGQPLVVPMCGSGTLAIEAALIGLGLAPGLARKNFGFMHLKGFDADAWRALQGEALKNARETLRFRIIASDMDENAVRAARENASDAGADRLIDFLICDFADTPIPREKGVVVLNPEYGRRLGDVQALETTYERIGDFFKQKCPGYAAFVFTGNPALAKKVGLRTSRRIPFFNARIECRLLRYDIY